MLLEADHARYRLCVQLGLCLGQPFNLHSGTEEVPGQEHKCQNPVASATDDHCTMRFPMSIDILEIHKCKKSFLAHFIVKSIHSFFR